MVIMALTSLATLGHFELTSLATTPTHVLRCTRMRDDCCASHPQTQAVPPVRCCGCAGLSPHTCTTEFTSLQQTKQDGTA
eukprot:jgi/Chrzof1/6323/Cz18g04080.t1